MFMLLSWALTSEPNCKTRSQAVFPCSVVTLVGLQAVVHNCSWSVGVSSCAPQQDVPLAAFHVQMSSQVEPHGRAGPLAVFCDQAGLQAMLPESEESLSRLLAWARPQAVFSKFIGSWAGLCCKVGLQVGLQGCPRSLFRLPGYIGPEAILNSWAGMLTWLSAQVKL